MRMHLQQKLLFQQNKKTMDSITVQIAKAREYQEKGQYTQALSIADAMIQKYPGQLDALGIKADILKEQGKK